MNPRIQVGKGITGAVRYCLGEGRNPVTGELLPPRADGTRRVDWIGGTGFSFEIDGEARADLARREMEFDALNQKSRTKKCEQDCVHLSLAWSKGETPTREEMEEAGRSALASIGMKSAKALFFAHGDEDYAHLHIVASKINPDTGRAYDLVASYRNLSTWSEQYEREHGGVVNTRRETANELRKAIAARDAAGVLEAMTKQRSTFTAAQLERVLQKEIHTKIGAPPEQKRSVELQRAQFANAILDHANAVHLCDQWGGPVTRYTTRAVIEAELHVLRAANGLVSNTTHGLDDRQRAATLNGARYDGITREQALAFRHVTGAEGLAIIDGQAGTGKSFTLAAVREAYEAAGCRVIGLAPTNKVARKMEADGFGQAKTVHSELFALNNARTSWDPKTVVIVDEAAMLDTKLMAMVTAHAHDAGAKLVLVGDDRQLSSIDRGGMFGTLKDRHGAAELSEVKRQHKIDHRRASEMMGEGNFHDALGIYEAAGNIHWTRTQTEARAELVEKWAKDTASTPHKSRFVFAYTNDDVNQLNDALRAVRKGRGELGQDHELATAHGRASFAAGDRIQFTGTDKQRGIDNGAAGTIEAIDGTHVAVRLDDRNGKIINFDAAAYDKFRHGYAGTIYKGQGDTLDQTYLFHSEHWRSAPAYVALTRHRENTELFVARGTARDVKELARQVARTDETRAAAMFHQREPIGPVRPMSAAEILAQFAGEGFGHQTERMESEGKHWPGARHYDPRPKPPWPSAREQRRPYQQDNKEPTAALDLDELAERVQRIIDDPTREADEHDDRVLHALKERRELAELDPGRLAERVQRIIDDPTREADEHDGRVLQALQARREEDQTAQPVTQDSEPEGQEPEAASSGTEEIDAAISGQEMTDDKQAQYSRLTGQQLGAGGGRPAAEPGRTRGSGGRSRTRTR